MTTMMCDSKERLVGYLYGELSEEEHRAFDAHVAVCHECREEVTALQGTRGQIRLWTPPDRDVHLQVVRGASGVAAPATPRWMPAWGLAAAAVLVLAASAAIANLEIRYGSEGLVVRTGWTRGAGAPAPAEAVSTAAAETPAADVKAVLAAFEQRLSELETAAPAPAATTQASAPSPISDAELIRRVRSIVAESETRQQRELAYRIQQVMIDFDVRRQTDLASIRQGLGQIQGTTEAEVARMRDYLYRVAQTQK